MGRSMRDVVSDILTWPWFSDPPGYNFNGRLVRDPVEPTEDDMDALVREGVDWIILANRNHSRAANRVRASPGARTIIHADDADHARSQQTELDDGLEVGGTVGPVPSEWIMPQLVFDLAADACACHKGPREAAWKVQAGAGRMSLALDHSLTYRDRRLRNLPHRLRLRAILRLVRDSVAGPINGYADFGCSNGFITHQVRTAIGARDAWGFDHTESHFDTGRDLYPDIRFQVIDLNRPADLAMTFDLVTCFETLEHVGDFEAAMGNLLAAVADDGVMVLSVPIEIGAIGLAKFSAKLALGYDLRELPPRPRRGLAYLRQLISGRRISAFREPRDGWGTHFGFDYRDLDDFLTSRGLAYRSWNSATTRFFVAKAASTQRGADYA